MFFDVQIVFCLCLTARFHAFCRCQFLLGEKGQRFVDDVQARHPHCSMQAMAARRNTDVPLVESGPSRIPSPAPQPTSLQVQSSNHGQTFFDHKEMVKHFSR